MFFEIADYPLPEDLEVRGFVGLRDPLVKLNFTAGLENGIPDDLQHSCRSYRYFYVYMSLMFDDLTILVSCLNASSYLFDASGDLSR